MTTRSRPMPTTRTATITTIKAATMPEPAPGMTNASRGLLLGLLGVVIFAATGPMTKLAVGSLDAPQLTPWFVTFGRAAVAGGLSLVYLLLQGLAARSQGTVVLPTGREWRLLGLTALGVVVGFPLFFALALRVVPSTHGAVVTGLLPLATAVVAALWFRQRPSRSFWGCALLGTGLVLAFMVLRSADSAGRLSVHMADVFLLAAMLSAAVGYVSGARLTPSLGAERVICWALVISLPVTLPMAWANAPLDASSIHRSSWWAFGYVALFSMWLGFFAWYRGLAVGGAVRVSQTQLVQPFLSLLIAVPLLGEPLDGVTLGFGAAVIASVFVSKKLAVNAAPAAPLKPL